MYNEAIWFCDYKQGQTLDKYGDPIEERVLSDLIFAEKRSISQTEFYQAQTSDKKPELKFVIPDYLDYSEQSFVIHNGMRYKILKTYQTDTNELEITCYGGVRDVNAEVGDENN